MKVFGDYLFDKAMNIGGTSYHIRLRNVLRKNVLPISWLIFYQNNTINSKVTICIQENAVKTIYCCTAHVYICKATAGMKKIVSIT